MEQEVSHNSETIDEIVRTACAELFDAYGLGLTERPPPKENEDHASDEDLAIAGVIGMTGDAIRGTLVLAGTSKPLEFTRSVGQVRDWVAELSNQLLGRIKNKLLQHGVEIYLSTPVTMAGRRLRIMSSGNYDSGQFLFETSAGGYICIWFDAELAEGLILEKVETEDEHTSEGDMLFF